jgi:A/G-specific adenine glycosylase
MNPVSDVLPSNSEAQVIRAKLRTWFLSHGRDLPWRRLPSPYAVLVSEFMLQQTQVATVIPYFERWMLRFPTVKALADAAESDVLQHWQGLGYYSRARNLHAAAKVVVAQFDAELPSDPALLIKLPGVGAYTAGAIASFAFDRPAAAVDANIARVLARLGDLRLAVDSTAGAAALWEHARGLLPEVSGGREHTSALMELGALVCTSKRPQCLVCPIHEHCHTREPETLPFKAPRKGSVRLDEDAAWIVKNGALLLEQQTGRRAGGLWKLPPLQTRPDTEPVFQTVYPFTHHRITLRVFEENPIGSAAPNQRWFPLPEVLEGAALTAPHRRALESLLAR